MWWEIVRFVIMVAISYALTPKPKSQTVLPQQLEAPTAAEGKEIPVLFGTRDISNANIVWYGDISTVPIKSSGGKK